MRGHYHRPCQLVQQVFTGHTEGEVSLSLLQTRDTLMDFLRYSSGVKLSSYVTSVESRT